MPSSKRRWKSMTAQSNGSLKLVAFGYQSCPVASDDNKFVVNGAYLYSLRTILTLIRPPHLFVHRRTFAYARTSLGNRLLHFWIVAGLIESNWLVPPKLRNCAITSSFLVGDPPQSRHESACLHDLSKARRSDSERPGVLGAKLVGVAPTYSKPPTPCPISSRSPAAACAAPGRTG